MLRRRFKPSFFFVAVGHLHSTLTSHLQPPGSESFSTDRFRESGSCFQHTDVIVEKKKRLATGPRDELDRRGKNDEGSVVVWR